MNTKISFAGVPGGIKELAKNLINSSNNLFDNKIIKDKGLKKRLKNKKITIDDVNTLKDEYIDLKIIPDEIMSYFKYEGVGNMRDLLIMTGSNYWRFKLSRNIHVALLSKYLLKKIEKEKEPIDIITAFGRAGSGKDTFINEFKYYATDTRFFNELELIIHLNTLNSIEEQEEYLYNFIKQININSENMFIDLKSEKEDVLYFKSILEKETKKMISDLEKIKKSKRKNKQNNTKRTKKQNNTKIIQLIRTFDINDVKVKEEQQKIYKSCGIEFSDKNIRKYNYLRQGSKPNDISESINEILYYIEKLKKDEISMKDYYKITNKIIERNYKNQKETKKDIEEDKKSLKSITKIFLENKNLLKQILNNTTIEETQKKVYNILEGDKDIKRLKLLENKTQQKSSEEIIKKYNLKDEDIQKIINETTIFFDYDEVLVDLITPWLEHINKTTPLNLKRQDITEFFIFEKYQKELDKKYGNGIYDVFDFLNGDTYKNVNVNEGSRSIIRKLKEYGFDIKIITASHTSSVKSKEEHIKKYFGDLIDYSNDVAFLKDKKLINMEGGIFIDDGIHNLESVLKRYETTQGILLDHSHNKLMKTDKRVVRIDSLNEIESVLLNKVLNILDRKILKSAEILKIPIEINKKEKNKETKRNN